MNKHLLLAISCLLFFTFTIQAESALYGSDANNIVPGAKQVILKDNSKIPTFIVFDDTQLLASSNSQEWITQVFKLNPAFGLQLINKTTDQIGFTHSRYLQTFNGHVIDGTMWITHEKSGSIHSMNGFLVDRIKESATNLISENDALGKALQHVHAQLYKWQIKAEENLLKQMLHDNNATYFPKGELRYSFDSRNINNRNYRLAYRFDIYSQEPLGRKYIFVDVQTGDITDVQDRIWESNANGTATTAYSGTQPIVTDNFAGGYRLRESFRGTGQGMETYNLRGGTDYATAIDFTDADNLWNNVNAAKDQYATDAHFAAEKTYDYYFNAYGRNSIDNAGLRLLSYVHYSTNYVNAFWDGTRMTYGDGNASFNPLTSLDIGGHEITHGLTSYTADLLYSNESGALNESFSDCFGTSVEWASDPAHADWLIGEDIGAPFRSHSNPNAYGDPDTYLGTNWYSGTSDNGGVHTNSGVQNFWFYLLSVGGSGTNDIGNTYSVSGIGINRAAAIAYRSLSFYLTSTSQYADARTYSIQAAIDLYGNCSPEMLATLNAWYAVGVGTNATAPTVLEQFGPSSFCSGDSLLLKAKANTGSAYQWFNNNVLINGVTGSSYYATNSGTYTVATNLCGNISTSNAIAINVVSLAPTVNPAGTVSSCSNVQLAAQNTAGYSVQWNKDGVPVNGATANTFTASQSGNYSFTLKAAIIPGQTLSNNSIVNIIDNSCNPTASSTITAAGLPSLIYTNGITIKINLTHTWDGDIDIMLQAPNGDLLGLSHNAGDGGDNFTNTIFSDSGVTDVSLGVAPFTGTFKPWTSLFSSCMNSTKTSFASIGNGTINPNGNWVLRVFDRYNQDSGTIVNWSISFPASTNPLPDCGPYTTTATNVNIGSDAAISVTPANNSTYSISNKAVFPTTGRSFGTAASVNGKAYYGFGDNTARSDWWEYNPSNDTWTQKSSCPQAQAGGSSFAIGNKIYVIGGFNVNYLNTVYQWDSSTNTWTQKNSFSGGARAYSSVVTVLDKGYIIGGNDNATTYNDIWEYNAVADSWQLKNNFGANGRKKMSAFTIAQKIYFGLGLSCGSPCVNSNQWFEYDIANNVVTAKANFPGAVRENANGFTIGSKGFILFGNAGSTSYNDYWDYNSLTDVWTSHGPLSVAARTGSASTVVNGRAYIFSGSVSGSPSTETLEFKEVKVVCTNTPAGVSLQATSGSSYLWSNGATTQSINGVSSGNYSVVVSNAGCTASAYTEIGVYPVPTATVTHGTLSFCSGGSVTLTADVNLAYQWSNGTTTRNNVVTNSGTYSVIVTGQGGCTNTSTPLDVNARPGPPVTIQAGGPTVFCQGGNVALTGYGYQSIPFAPLPGSGTAVTLTDDQLTAALPIGFTFTFFGNAYTTFNISSNGFISFTGSSSGCCTGQLIPNATVPNNLIAFAWTDLYPPAGGSIEYFTTGTAPDRKLIVKFNGIRHYPNVNPVTAQVILFETTNYIEIHTTSMITDGTLHTMGLENSTGTQAVAIPGRNRASFSLTNDAVRFTTKAPVYAWSTGGTNSSITATTTGNYSVTVSEPGGCIATSSPMAVVVNPLPTANISASGSTALCTGDSVTLTSTSGASYLWSTGATTQSINVHTSGNYTVTVTSNSSCSKTSAATNVTVNNCSSAINLKVFLQGYYKGGGMMDPAVDGPTFPNLCDTIIVELHNSNSPFATAFSVKGTINVNGNGNFVFPGITNGNSYYIVVKHRNGLETWSAAPVIFSGTISYDFTTAANKAFGNNQVSNNDGSWSIYSGDISSSDFGLGIQDGVIESQDYLDMENAVAIIKSGYIVEDLTGDHIVEASDYIILENNVGQIIISQHP